MAFGFMRFACQIALIIFLGGQAAYAENQPGFTLRLDRDAHIWHLQANHTSLPAILRELQHVSGMIIHYSVLPQAAITATCAAGELSALLKCLLGESAGLVFGQTNTDEPKEAWILGTTATAPMGDCSVEYPTESYARPDNQELYAEVQNSDPRRRAEALYALAASDDNDVEAILRSGMRDKSALVRGQAIGGWVRRFGAEAAESELQQAFADADAAVRMQAVELTVSPDLLSQGLQDSDAMVRQLAQAKLDELTH